MSLAAFSATTFGIAVFAGLLGSLLGLGGGIIIVPALTLYLGVDIRHAIGASVISVIATSSGAAIAFLRDRITNLRLGMFLNLATTLGALAGAFAMDLVEPRWLFLLFGLLLGYSALAMYRKRNVELPGEVPEHPLAARLRLSGSYYDKALAREVSYSVTGVYSGWVVMFVAGVLSGLLGIGSGLFKVLGMDVFMKLPMKVSTATSNFMIGVTAAASAGVYFSRGEIDPVTAAPVALGVLLGALAGTRVMGGMKNTTLRKLFIPILLYTAAQMAWKGWNG